jgi:hypothetical protein
MDWDTKNTHIILNGKHERKRTLANPGREGECNIKKEFEKYSAGV